MSTIVPAILEDTKDDFFDKESRVVMLPGAQRIHIDFADGIFVPRKTLQVTDMDTLNLAFHWEAHIMAHEPLDFFEYQLAGFKTIIVHYEAYPNVTDLRRALEAIKSQNMEAGISLNPGTEVSLVKEFEDSATLFQIMSVNPGYQGQEFLPHSLEKVSALRRLIPNAIIEVDGGINFSNAKQVAAAGADFLIGGSVLMKAPNMQEAWEKLNVEVSSIKPPTQ